MTATRLVRRSALLIFALGLVATLAVWASLQHTVRDRDDLRLAALGTEIGDRIRNQLNVITYGLAGANGVFAASESVERHEFRAYVGSRNLPVEFPGVFGFGYAEYVPEHELSGFLERVRRDKQPEFRLRRRTSRRSASTSVRIRCAERRRRRRC
jgi:CHASE1-domain containing sensor protein